MKKFDEAFDAWMHDCIDREENPRRIELLERGLGH